MTYNLKIKKLTKDDITSDLIDDCHRYTANLVKHRGKEYLPLFEKVTQIKNDFEKDEKLLSMALKIANDN